MTKEEKQKQIFDAVEAYKNSTSTIKKISKLYNIRLDTLSKYLKLNNIEIRKNPIQSSKSNKIESISPELKELGWNLSKTLFKLKLIDLAIEEYINTSIYDRSISKLADKYGLNRKTIVKYLNKRGVKITSTHEKVPFNEGSFDIIDTEEKAYWLGFMYADGYISSKNNKIGLSLSVKDFEHLQKFNNFLNYSKGMNIVDSHQFGSSDKVNKNNELLQMVSTVITNSHMWKALKDKGCAPNKSLILTFPNKEIFKSEDLIRHFIRGYVDGDGTLGVYSHSKSNPKLEASLSMVGTKPFLEGVLNYLNVKGFLMHKQNCNEKTYRLGYSTKKAELVADILYKNASIYLTRKHNIYTSDFAALKSGKNGEG